MPANRVPSQAERAAAVGARIRQLRRQAGLTQRQLAERLPMSSGNLSRIENGDQGPPSDEVLQSIAAALEIDPVELLSLATTGSSDRSRPAGASSATRRTQRWTSSDRGQARQ
jgi:transcriptional regulator with XRE-family HTH domain